MYFASRVQAGRMLAAQLLPDYRYENCAVIGIGDGGVIIGAQIAAQLHCLLTMLIFEEVFLPREPVAIGGVLQNGSFSYNKSYSDGEIDEMASEYHGLIEQEKFEKFHKINGLAGNGGNMTRDHLRGHNIILASDGFKDSFSLDMALDFLKPIAIDKIIVAAPIASIRAVDRMHITVDQINCLTVVEDYMDTDHYYDQKDIPEHDVIMHTIDQIALMWK